MPDRREVRAKKKGRDEAIFALGSSKMTFNEGEKRKRKYWGDELYRNKGRRKREEKDPTPPHANHEEA